MKVTSAILAGTFAAISLAACATLDDDTCRAGDWEQIGFKDGVNGRGPAFIRQHAKACNDIGIAPVRSLWESGRQDGLKLYCTPDNAYDEGADGRHLRDVCPVEGVDVLEYQNDRGLTWYRIGRDIRQAEARIREINAELKKLPSDDPARIILTGERMALRLDILHLRARRHHFR
ncbi:MAG: DUF2799 domain-containing protein [Boseongicola sp.]|nr:MAG: DUF2799 domain-containing protein [Boseongicola sp.]